MAKYCYKWIDDNNEVCALANLDAPINDTRPNWKPISEEEYNDLDTSLCHSPRESGVMYAKKSFDIKFPQNPHRKRIRPWKKLA